MGFNKRKMEDACRQAAEQEAAARRATDRQIPRGRRAPDHGVERAPGQADAHAVFANDRRRDHGRPLVPAGALPGLPHRTTGDVDLRTLDWHRGAAVTALTPALSCRSCRPNAPFAELVCLSKPSVAEEYYAERGGNRWVSE